LDYWIVAGDSPAEIEEKYAGVTGTVPMMPEYVDFPVLYPIIEVLHISMAEFPHTRNSSAEHLKL
jgi:hypothetical protein